MPSHGPADRGVGAHRSFAEGDRAAPSGAYVSGQMIGRAVPLEGGDVVVVGGPREANVA